MNRVDIPPSGEETEDSSVWKRLPKPSLPRWQFELDQSWLGLARESACALILAVIAVYAARQVIFRPGYLPGADSYGHLLSVWYATKELVEAGRLPLWLPYWYNGLDYLQYDSILYTFLALPIQWFSQNVETTYRVLLIPMLVSPVLGAFFLARNWLGRGASMIAALAFGLSALQMRLLFLEGAEAEAVAIGLSPWVFHVAWRLFNAPTRRMLITLSVLIAAMLLAHERQALMFLALLVPFFAIAALRERIPLANLLPVALGVVGGIVLSSAWLLPALGHWDSANLPFLQSDSVVGYSTTLSILDTTFGVRNLTALHLGLPIFLMALASLFLRRTAVSVGLLVVAILSFLLGLGVNLPLYKALPLAWEVLPSRFLHISSLFLALCAGMFLEAAIRHRGRHRVRTLLAALVGISTLVADQTPYLDLARTLTKPITEGVVEMLRGSGNEGRLQLYVPSTPSDINYFPVVQSGRLLAGGWGTEGTLQHEATVPQGFYTARGRADYVLHNMALWNVSQVAVEPLTGPEAQALQRGGYEVTAQMGQVAVLSKPQISGYVFAQDRDVIAIGIDARHLVAIFPWAAVGTSIYLDDYSDDYLSKFKLVLLYQTKLRDQVKGLQVVERMLDRGQMVIVANDEPAMTDLQGVTTDRRPIQGMLETRITGGDILGEARSITLGTFQDVGGTRLDIGPWVAMQYLGLDEVLAEVVRGEGKPSMPLFGYKRTDRGRLYFLGFSLLHHAIVNNDEATVTLLAQIFDSVAPNKAIAPASLDVDFRWGTDSFSFDYAVQSDTMAIVSVAYSPHWEATINGRPASYSNHENLIEMHLPAGQGKVSFAYLPTPAQSVGWALSLLGVIFLALVTTLAWGWTSRPSLVLRTGIENAWEEWKRERRRRMRDRLFDDDIAWVDEESHHFSLPKWAVWSALVAASVFIAWPIYGTASSPPGIDIFGQLLKPWYMLQHFSQYGSVPDWLPYWYNGTSLTQYYPPLAYYTMFAIGLLARNIFTAYMIFITLAFVLAALLTYALARRWFGQFTSLIVAAAYIASPYTLTVVFGNGDLQRTLATVLLPLVLWLAVRLMENDSWKDYLALPLATAALVLADQMSAAATIAGLLPFAAIYAWRTKLDAGRPLRMYITLALGLGLSASWLIPAFTHIDLAGVPDFSSRVERIGSHSAGWTLLDPRTRFDRDSYLGITILIISALVLRFRKNSPLKWACAAGALLGLFLSLGKNNPAYPYLSFIAEWYPDHFLQMTALLLAILVGLGAQMLRDRDQPAQRKLLVGVVLALLVFDLTPNMTLARPTISEEILRIGVNRVSEWLARQENTGRLMVLAPINWETAFTPVAVGRKEQNFGLAPEGTPHTVTSQDMSHSIAHKRYSFALRTFGLWNTRYLMIDRTNDDQMALASELLQQGWRKADLQVPWLIIYLDRKPTPLLKQDRDILVVGRGATTAARLFPWVARGGSEYIDDYSADYLAQFKGVWLYDYRMHDRKNTEALLRGLAERGMTIWVDVNLGEGETLFHALPMRSDIKGMLQLEQVAEGSAAIDGDGMLGPFDPGGAPWRTTLPQPPPGFDRVVQAKIDDYTFAVISRQRIGQGAIYLVGLNLAAQAFLNEDKAAERVLDNLLKEVKPNTAIELEPLDAESEWWHGEAFGFRASTNEPTPAVVSVTYTPRWRATVDGAAVPVYNYEDLLSVSLPAGQHEVRFSYGSSTAEGMGRMISLLAALLLALGLALPSQKITRFVSWAWGQTLLFLGWK